MKNLISLFAAGATVLAVQSGCSLADSAGLDMSYGSYGGWEQLPATNYVFLIDVSGSMNSPDKLGILKAGFTKLTEVLGAQDRVAVVTYSGSVSVLLPSTHGDQKDNIRKAIKKLSAGGSTAGGAAIEMAYDIAERNFIPGGNNRIILGTDGDFNVGVSTDEQLTELIEGQRDKGIYITVLGVGGGNLNDSMMEKVANKGNGTYEYIDNASQIEKVFVKERSKFYAAAKDCKIQITFDPSQVEKYRLIGYENRVMSEEDFDDDTKDAGDIGVGQTVTALYEILPAESASGDPYASLEVRYKKPGENESILLSSDVNYHIHNTMDNNIPVETNFAAGVAAFGMLLKESEYAGSADKEMILSLCRGGLGFDPHGYRRDFIDLVEDTDL
jgi:Ca-activated chloride channel family protein